MKRGPPPQVVGCVGGQSAAPSWPSFPLQYLPRPASTRPPKPPHIFHLALSGCPSSQELLSNKGTWNHRNWVRPSRQMGQASENSVQVLGSQRALGFLSPYPDMVAHSSGALRPQRHLPRSLGNVMEHSGQVQAHPQHQTLLPPPHRPVCVCRINRPAHPPLSPVLHSHLSPLASESIL